MKTSPIALIVGFTVSVAACGLPVREPKDAGESDSGIVDSGSTDSGAGDSGQFDASTSDGGPPDASTSDGGPPDANILDGGPPDANVFDGGLSSRRLAVVADLADGGKDYLGRGGCDSDAQYAYARLLAASGPTDPKAISASASLISSVGDGAFWRKYPVGWDMTGDVYDPMGTVNQTPTPGSVNITNSCHFAQLVLVRILLDPKASANLSGAARTSLLNTGRFLLHSDRLPYTDMESLWEADGENHGATIKVARFLFAQILKATDANTLRTSGLTPAARYASYVTFYKEYFRLRARHGLLHEIGTFYNDITLLSILDLRDFAEDPALRALADGFLTLVFADAAQDFLPATGIRGGAQTRTYKSANLSRQYTGVSALAYLYGWHDNAPPTSVDRVNVSTDIGRNSLALAAAVSSYSPPSIITATAKDTESRTYVSQRMGRGTNQLASTLFLPGSVRRESWRTPAYVMGTLTLGLGLTDTHLYSTDENRNMGVWFASGSKDMLTVTGIGDSEATCNLWNGSDHSLGCQSGYREIYGVTAPNAMVVARDPSSSNAGTRIFVSTNLWNALTPDGGQPRPENGWYFSQTPQAYVAFRFGDGGFAPDVRSQPADFNFSTEPSDGTYMVLNEPNAPVVIQTSPKQAFVDLVAFKSAVASRPYSYDAVGGLDYTSLAGDRLEVFGGRTVPKKNGVAVNLTPKIYDSPGRLLGDSNSNTVVVKFPGMSDLSLGFCYLGAPADAGCP